MNAYLALILTASYYLLCLPLFTLFRWALILIAPLYFALQFILLPLVFLGRFSLQAALLPLTLLAKLEVDAPPLFMRNAPGAVYNSILTRPHQTIYIYVGVASVIGIIAGCVLHVSTRVLKSMFGLDNTCTKSPHVRSAADYRAERRRRRKRIPVAVPQAVEPLEPPRESRLSKQRSLWSQPILEEDDSESC